MRNIVLFLVSLIAISSADTLTTFQAGTPISAAEMNANFQNLATLISQQSAEIAALKAEESPQGAIIASLQAPQADGYLSANATWYNCVGGTINGVTIPDLRGVFLRGLDQGAGRDEDGPSRTAGSYQVDEFKSHTHTANMEIGAEPTHGAAQSHSAAGSHGQVGVNYTSNYVLHSSGGSETRPENVAVYYYIKVK